MLHLWKRQMQTLLSRSLVDSWASCTIWQCVVRSFTKKRTFPWNMVFPDRRGEKANQSVHQWRQEFCCSWCRMCCHIPLNRKIRKIQNSWSVPFPLVWLEKSSGWISLLKDPHLLCRFDKEIYLLEKKNHCRYLLCLILWEARLWWMDFVFPVHLKTPRNQQIWRWN